ncbi:MAG: AAA family ATPase [Lachnospiraceae bacterium]|nr:AAA family ATPase [Lachnospiraceae bacterium]
MSIVIEKIRLQNYKRFLDYTVNPNPRINILIGDNEVGKSSILEAIDIVASGNLRRIEAIGIDKLLNIDAVRQFGKGARTIENLPIMRIELYLAGQFDHTMNGKNNTDRRICDGIRLVCEPNIDYAAEIRAALEANSDYFPYDYYSVRFSTFADEPYTGYKKKLRSIIIDSARMSTEFATSDFVRRMYRQYTESNEKERIIHKSQYRQMRTNFQVESLQGLNGRVPGDKNYTFGLKSGSSMDLESDLMIYEDEIGIDSKGTGKQVFIKTDFALERSGENVDVVLIEEPENHLSPVNLRRLVQRVASAKEGQLFVTTHSSMISTRLEINNLLIMHQESAKRPIMLRDLSDDTAKYFAKTPPASIVEYALARKALLVEGPAEYMLMEKNYKACTGSTPEEDEVNVIDVRGLSFKRYLEISKLTGSKVAVITDNDSDYQKNCVDKYADFAGDSNIEVFYDSDNNKRTFEIVLEACNTSVCAELFGQDAVTFMLNNKTEAAFRLLSENKALTVPDYIKRAVEWIRQ